MPGSFRTFLSRLRHGLWDLLYPPACLVCGRPLDGGEEEPADSAASAFCSGCAVAIFGGTSEACPCCAATVGPHARVAEGCVICRKEHFAFDAALRLGTYEGKLREVVLRMKRHHNAELAEMMGELWADRSREAFLATSAAMIVPVPLHWWRRFRRGYNQSDALALGLGTRLGLPVRASCLRRSRYTPPQTALSGEARRANVRGAFRAFGPTLLTGKTVLLVDDVMTTGSTLHEAARALRQAGARRVVAAALARAGLD